MVRQNWQMWVGQNGFSIDECNKIIEQSVNYPAKDGGIFSSNDLSDVRVSTIRWMNDQDIALRLWGFISDANKAFNVDVEPLTDIQFTEYHGTVNGKYDDHHDVDWNRNDGKDRKLSLIVQLSDKKDYDGGNFEFTEVQNPNQHMLEQQGSVLVFPSYLQHHVTPVTRGVRRSLVAWFEGPQWK